MPLRHHPTLLVVLGQEVSPALGILPEHPDGNSETNVPDLRIETLEKGDLTPIFVRSDDPAWWGSPVRPSRFVILPHPDWIGAQAATNVVTAANHLRGRLLRSGELAIVCADTSPATVWLALGVARAAPEDASGAYVAFDGHVQPADMTAYRDGRAVAKGSDGPGLEG